MQRDMSSPMDASMSTRNQGQLVSTETVVTRPARVGNMQEVPLQGRGVRNLTTRHARPLQLGDITVDGLGTTTWKWLLASAVGGVILWKMTGGARNKSKRAARKAIDALKEG